MMDKNRVKGAAKQAEGKLQDIRGSVTGSITDNVEGKAKIAAGKVQSAVGRLKDKARAENNTPR